MKKVLLILVICMFAAGTAFAGLSELSKAPVTAPIDVSGMALEDFLAMLSRESGITLVAVPEVAEMKIDLKCRASPTLADILIELKQRYALRFCFFGENAVLIQKAPGYDSMLNARGDSARVAVRTHRAALVDVPQAPAPFHAFNTEEYKRIYDNRFQDTAVTPLSTFSIDVDTASYSNIRRFINDGLRVPQDVVRTEEMINYFRYDYPQPAGSEPFAVTAEISACPWQKEHKLALIALQGKNIPVEELPLSNLVFLIDVSGSMFSPNKLPLVKTAFGLLVSQLRPQDKVAVVVYAGRTGVVLEPTSGSDKDTIMRAIYNLEAGGSTAGGEGILMAYKLARESFMHNGNNRVIMATDGDFNVGVSSEGELEQLIETQRNDGIFLSVLGFGVGNIKDNKMQVLADKGNGNYAYIDNALEAKKVLVGQMAGTLYTIAKDVKLQVEFNPAQVKGYRLIGYEKRVIDNSDFADDAKDAGDMGASHTVTALYEIIPAKTEDEKSQPLVFQRPELIPSEEWLQLKIRYKQPDADASVLFTKRVGREEYSDNPSENFRFAAAVAEYAMLLRNSEYKGEANFQQVLALAKSAKGEDDQGYRGEFIRMVNVSKLFARE